MDTGNDKGLPTDKPYGVLTRMMRIKIRLCNLSNRIKFHLCRSRVMAVLCIMGMGFIMNVSASALKKKSVIFDFCLGFSSSVVKSDHVCLLIVLESCLAQI